MKSLLFFHIVIFFSLAARSYSQDIFITKPRLTFKEKELEITYDIITNSYGNKFYVWVEIINDQGNTVKARSLSGDVGENIEQGYNKIITWTPEKDSVYLNEKIFVQVKAEKYVRSFDRSTMLFKSVILPGWGQSRVSNKPFWISSVAVYGLMAGGIIYQKKHQKSYSAYRFEENSILRNELLRLSQNQLDISSALIYTSISAWVANLVWVVVVPEKYRPIQNVSLTVNPSVSRHDMPPTVSLRFEF